MKKSRSYTRYIVCIVTTVVVSLSFASNQAHESYQLEQSTFLGRNIGDFVKEEFIIKFSPDTVITIQRTSNQLCLTGVSSVDILNEKHKVSSIERMFSSHQDINENNPFLYNIFKFIVPVNSDIQSIVQEYEDNTHVLYAEPNYKFQLSNIPNDPDFYLQWALHNTGQTGGTPDADIDAPEAWDIETGDKSIIIAIHDTGVDWDHPDLADNIWVNPGEDLNGNGVVDPSDFNGVDDDSNGFIDDLRGWDFVDTNDTVAPGEDGTVRDNDPMDFYGHGTHCSGIASADTNNTIGIAGVCWNCSIMAVRAGYLKENGDGRLEVDDATEGVIYAVDNGADVLSMSWGGYNDSDLVKDVMNYAYSNGVILVAAAGNFCTYLKLYPAAYGNVIGVAATDQTDSIATFSNYGSWVDVAAPGVNILSTMFNDTYFSWGGTSMSTPTVAGLAALILSKHPEFTQEEVQTIIRSTTDTVHSQEFIGIGRINAYKAIQRDSTPIVNLNSILDDAIIYQETSINGSAWGSHFVNYSIYYGIGMYPTAWTKIYESSTPVTDEMLAILNASSLLVNQIYTIRLVVYDTFNQISEDRVIVLTDTAPDIPEIEGPSIGKIKVKHDYFFTTLDHNEDKIYYYIDWGDDDPDEWLGPYESGEEIRISHTWMKKGNYTIKAKAKDIHGAESNWSSLTITMPNPYRIPTHWFLTRIIQRFSNVESMLRFLRALRIDLLSSFLSIFSYLLRDWGYLQCIVEKISGHGI